MPASTSTHPSATRPVRPRRRARAAIALALPCLALALVGCASWPKPSGKPSGPASANAVEGRSCQEPEEMLDVLARFTTLVQARKYHEAIALLDPADQKRMLDAGGSVPTEIMRKLDALDFKALPNDRRVDLVRGRLTGIFDCLPCLDQGPPDTVTRAEPPKPAVPDAAEKKRAALALEFYRRIQEGRFDAAGDMVDPGDWKVFYNDKGEMTDLTERRLQAMQECDLEALTLRGGKLVGVVVLLDPPVSDLYLAAMRFFDAVDQDRIDDAIGMLLESEKKFFLGPDGKPRPDRVARLKAMDRADWNRLYLYHHVLLGVAEAAIGYGNL
jgi:hypothetical protein